MIAMNCVLVRGLFTSKMRMSTRKRSKRREINYALTVVALNFIFFILNLPWCIWYILNQISFHDSYLSTTQAKRSLEVLKSVSFSVYYLDNLSLFFLNFIFNRLFRKRVLFIICSQLCLCDNTSRLAYPSGTISFSNSTTMKRNHHHKN